jgi:hypothetical protein
MKPMSVAIFLFSSFLSHAGEFSYPTTPLSEPSNIDLNLINEFEREVAKQKSEKELSRILIEKNKFVLTQLKNSAPSSKSLTEVQAAKLRQFLIQHPIAGDSALDKYSKTNSTVGYCFGRATLAHVELLRRGVDPKSIRKIFVIGEMKYTLDIWELHVATIVKKTGGGWWVLDGLFNKTLEVQDWYKEILKIAVNTAHPKIRLYLTDPVKFLPITGAYAEKDMFREEYNGFFKDLSAWLTQNPVKKEDMLFSPAN